MLNKQSILKQITLSALLTFSGCSDYQVMHVVKNKDSKRCFQGFITGYLDLDKWHDSYECLTLKKPDINGTYFNFSFSSDLMHDICVLADKNGAIPYITLDPKFVGNFMDLEDILGGKYDSYISELAKGIKKFRKPVLFRWAHEMNGDWYNYGGVFQGGGNDLNNNGSPDGPEKYVNVWNHVHSIFKKSKANNALWIFCPAVTSYPSVEWNEWFNYYPGDSCVDIIGVDVYNKKKDVCESFESLVFDFYKKFKERAISKRLMICEFGSVEGNSPSLKSDWIKGAFRYVISNDDIMAAVYFDFYDKSGGEEFWINSSKASVEAFKYVLSDDKFNKSGLFK